MNEAKRRIIRALSEAHACELTLAQTLQSQIDAAPRGSYRKGLQAHLRETHGHARRAEQRLGELGQRDNPMLFGIRLVESALGPLLAVGKAPLGLIRSSAGPEQVLEDARDACATEAAQIARYTVIERVAESSGDRDTASLAASIRRDEQKLLDHLLGAIPSLTSWLLEAELHGKAPAAIKENGAAAAAGSKVMPKRKAAMRATRATKRKAPQSRAVPRAQQRKAPQSRAVPRAQQRKAPQSRAVPRAQQRAERGEPIARPSDRVTPPSALIAPRREHVAPPSESVTWPATDLPIANYHALTVDETITKLGGLSQTDLAKVDSYERQHQNRSPILTRIASLRAAQVTPGYPDTDAGEINAAHVLGRADQAPPRRPFGGLPEDRESEPDVTRKELAGA